MSIRHSPCRWRSHLLVTAILLWTTSWSQAAVAGAPLITIAPGAGSFSFVDVKGDPSKSLTVYTYLPKRLTPNAARIVFVMHGHGNDAKGNRDIWVEHAETYEFMVLAPLFDSRQWGGGAYAYASVVTKDGKIREPSMWSFSAVEHLFDAVREATGNQSPRYFIYGHSEGGQFVHRLVLFLPDARYAKAVAANPGWYTMPSFNVRFPYGLDGSPATEESLRRSLGREFVLMLGDRDTDPNHKDLRRTPQAMVQGVHRFERGLNYMKEARDRAAALNSPFAWQVQVVPGAAHENARMSRSAATFLMGR